MRAVLAASVACFALAVGSVAWIALAQSNEAAMERAAVNQSDCAWNALTCPGSPGPVSGSGSVSGSGISFGAQSAARASSTPVSALADARHASGIVPSGASAEPGAPRTPAAAAVPAPAAAPGSATTGTTGSPSRASGAGAPAAPAAHIPVPHLAPAPAPALALDSPDPDVIVDGNTYYAYATGTVWGNSIAGSMCFTSACPASGWITDDGSALGSTMMPAVPSWQVPGTQTSPGTVSTGGGYVMYYDAVDAATGNYCISVATSTQPNGPFADTSSGPFICQTQWGGSIDPSPFVDPSGQLWLVWKSNDGSSTQPAWLWSVAMSPNGLAPAGTANQILFQDMAAHPWEATIENPDMVFASGHFYLFFSGGLWNSPGYAEGYAVCDSPAGGCTQPGSGPILSTYGPVEGPGGGEVFTDRSGATWMAYAAWSAPCTSYTCGGARELYVAPLSFQ